MATTVPLSAADRWTRPIGGAVIAAGLTHFVVPDRIVPVVAPVFPTNTRRHVLINGGLETLLGLGLAIRRTRRAALLGVAGYLGYVTLSALRHR